MTVDPRVDFTAPLAIGWCTVTFFYALHGFTPSPFREVTYLRANGSYGALRLSTGVSSHLLWTYPGLSLGATIDVPSAVMQITDVASLNVGDMLGVLTTGTEGSLLEAARVTALTTFDAGHGVDIATASMYIIVDGVVVTPLQLFYTAINRNILASVAVAKPGNELYYFAFLKWSRYAYYWTAPLGGAPPPPGFAPQPVGWGPQTCVYNATRSSVCVGAGANPLDCYCIVPDRVFANIQAPWAVANVTIDVDGYLQAFQARLNGTWPLPAADLLALVQLSVA